MFKSLENNLRTFKFLIIICFRLTYVVRIERDWSELENEGKQVENEKK